MSPRLASSSASAPAPRASARTRSSTAIPAEPYDSKNADCGLSTATVGPRASTTVNANRSNPLTVTGRPQSSSSSGCGSIPTHNGPRLSIAATSLAPTGSMMDNETTPLRWVASGDGPIQFGEQRRTGVDEPGVDLQQARSSIQHPQPIPRVGNAADPDHRQVTVRRHEAHYLDGA